MKIKIYGKTGEGKTAMAYAIEDICRKHGVECQLIGETEEVPDRMREQWSSRLASVGRECCTHRTPIKVEVETLQERRFVFDPPDKTEL
jgi:hypothetical protein